ncbi:hypothetical protein NQ318_012127, partial [Aromia moschata]
MSANVGLSRSTTSRILHEQQLRAYHYSPAQNLLPVRHFQHEFKINIWCGIIGDYLVGPFELPAKLNGQDYLNLLQENLVDLLEEVPLRVRANM